MVKKVTKKEKELKELEAKTEEILKTADELINAPHDPVVEAPKYINPPPQGSVAKFMCRTQEDVDKLDPAVKVIIADPEGKFIPEWVQVGRMFNRPHKKVAIIGFADTRNDAPFLDPSWEIWGLNDLHGSIPRYDRWFDIHTRDNIDEDVRLNRTPPGSKCGLGGLATLNVPVYMQERYDDVPNSIKFPLKEITDKYGNYFTNSISYMTALAIYEGYHEIAIFGVDMAVSSEYNVQRPSCEYFIGLARGAGIKVYIPPASDLCKTRFLYAFEATKQHQYKEKIESMIKNMSQRNAQIVDQIRQLEISHNQYEGAIGATREIDKIWANLDDKI
jgi:hypothetical protein